MVLLEYFNLLEDISYGYMEQDLLKNPNHAQYYDNIPEEIQIKLVKQDPYVISKISNLSEKAAREAVKQDIRLLHTYIIYFGPDFDLIYYVKNKDPKYFDHYAETLKSIPEDILAKINKKYDQEHKVEAKPEENNIINFKLA